MPYLGDADGFEAAGENTRDCHDVRKVIEAVCLELIGSARAGHVSIYRPGATQVHLFTLCVIVGGEVFPGRGAVAAAVLVVENKPSSEIND